jgi:hypothetical protein
MIEIPLPPHPPKKPNHKKASAITIALVSKE